MLYLGVLQAYEQVVLQSMPTNLRKTEDCGLGRLMLHVLAAMADDYTADEFGNMVPPAGWWKYPCNFRQHVLSDFVLCRTTTIF